MGPWDAGFERACCAHVDGVIAGADASARERAWQALLVQIAPRIEAWTARNRVLARWRLTGEDDVRAVLVGVLTRLARDEYAALRRFHARTARDDDDVGDDGARDDDDDDQRGAVERLARLADADEDAAVASRDADADTDTPLRALLLVLVRRAAADHVRYRLGWTDAGGRRVVGTDANRLSSVPEHGARPPVTDYLTLRKLLDEIEQATAEFPPPMRSALRLWMHDASFPEIAAELELTDEAAARKLVRAGHARLRERFRGEWAALF